MLSDMRFGLFGGAQTGGGRGFHDFIDFNVEAEALGYHSTFCVEHHFTGWSQISATLNLLTWLAARTRALRVGTAVMVLPWHNPVLLAEQVAVLDVLSGGRVDLGIGKGYRHTEFRGFCIPIEESQARFDEALEVMTKSWTSTERFSHRGRYWHFDDIVVEPRPVQEPHPLLWMTGGSPPSIRRVAAYGANLLLDQFAQAEVIGQRIAMFKAEIETRGRAFDPMSVAVARDVYVAKDEADMKAALARAAEVRRRTIEVSRAPDRQGGSHILTYDHDEAGNSAAVYGSPDEIAMKLETLRAVGVGYVLASFGGSRESLQRFAREIAPAFS